MYDRDFMRAHLRSSPRHAHKSDTELDSYIDAVERLSAEFGVTDLNDRSANIEKFAGLAPHFLDELAEEAYDEAVHGEMPWPQFWQLRARIIQVQELLALLAQGDETAVDRVTALGRELGLLPR